MAIATFYTTSKRHNSTLIPADGVEIAVNLKGGADLNAPLFLLNSSSIPRYSMMMFEGKYYFINRVRNIRQDLYELECSVDVLATYKEEIQATDAFILYHNHTNTEISDKRISTNTIKAISSATGQFDTLGNVGSGANAAVVVNVMGEGSCCSYGMTQSEANNLMNNYDDWWRDESQLPPPQEIQSLTDVAEVLKYTAEAFYYSVKQLFSSGSAAECLRSAIMLPIPKSALSGSSAPIYLGKYRTALNGTKIYDRIFSDGCTVNIPWQASDWRRNAPYTEIYLYIPYIGLVSISPSDVIGESSINISVNLDVSTGDSIFTIYTATHKLGQYSTNLGSSFAIGSSNITPLAGATAIGAAAVSAVTGGMASVIAGSAGFNGLANFLSGMPSTYSGNSGAASIGLNSEVACFTIFHDTVANPHNLKEVIGEPTNKVMNIGDISGYVQTLVASVAGSMTDDERMSINALLDGGVYIE